MLRRSVAHSSFLFSVIFLALSCIVIFIILCITHIFCVCCYLFIYLFLFLMFIDCAVRMWSSNCHSSSSEVRVHKVLSHWLLSACPVRTCYERFACCCQPTTVWLCWTHIQVLVGVRTSWMWCNCMCVCESLLFVLCPVFDFSHYLQLLFYGIR